MIVFHQLDKIKSAKPHLNNKFTSLRLKKEEIVFILSSKTSEFSNSGLTYGYYCYWKKLSPKKSS
jgi:hypothetical protein